MKKDITFILYLICILVFTACAKPASPIALPDISKITAIDITEGENTVNHIDATWIKETIFDISNSEPTRKKSVQDVPQTEHYIKIDIQFKTGTSTIFAYEDGKKYYIEQPYQGIYEIDSQLYNQLR